MQKKTAILIDGSNFYFKLKDIDLEDQLLFDFKAFGAFLSQGNHIAEYKYYIGAVKTDGTKKMKLMHATQQQLFKHLQNSGINYELGYLLKSQGKYHEKGVDVHMALDILVNTYERKVDKIVLVSSDTDLIPAIRLALTKGVQVEYIGFSHQPSVALKSCCPSSKILTQKDIRRFTSQQPKPARSARLSTRTRKRSKRPARPT